MKTSPSPLHSRYPPRKLLLFLLSNIHPAIGVMGKTKLINNTNKVMAACEFRGMFTGKVNVMGTANALGHIDINGQGKQFLSVMIFCDGISLLNSSEQDLVLRGEEFFSFKTVTIDQVPGDSTGVVNYEVKFEKPRHASVSAALLKVWRHLDVDHDNGWSVQHSVNGIVKLTREEGMTITLDPSKLFARNIVHDPPETLLVLNVFLKFWPRTFADLSCKDDLGTTICNVNYLMRQAKFHHANESNRVEVDNVVENVNDLHKSCATMVEWYRPLFPNIQFPQVANQMAEVDQGKLERFAAYIVPLLQPPNSLP